jgi:hypothetical protein
MTSHVIKINRRNTVLTGPMGTDRIDRLRNQPANATASTGRPASSPQQAYCGRGSLRNQLFKLGKLTFGDVIAPPHGSFSRSAEKLPRVVASDRDEIDLASLKKDVRRKRERCFKHRPILSGGRRMTENTFPRHRFCQRIRRGQIGELLQDCATEQETSHR